MTMESTSQNESKLNFSNFDDIKVSTKTFTATTNLCIDLEKLYGFLPITPYTVVPKRRGRKPKGEVVDPNKHIKSGSIITVKKRSDEVLGVVLKKSNSKSRSSDKKEKGKQHFRNSITIVMVLDKHINFKISRNGTFQMTGCKTHEHAELCVEYIWSYIKDNTDLYQFSRGDALEVLYIPCMRNIDFSLGFVVDREKLTKYIKNQCEFHCLLETLFGYTGVNIKIPIDVDINRMTIKKKAFVDGEWSAHWTEYREYLDMLKPKDRNIKINKSRYNTFLVFQSGKCIMSGLKKDYMKDVYSFFLNVIRNAYDQIEERLVTDSIEEAEKTLEEELAEIDSDDLFTAEPQELELCTIEE